ncbi:MAG TPA: hypothetical protein G4O13_07925 [Dehalococcoidia bacterium]|nr:hypothetical protein [Dehalococcoidia bacterium]
MDKEVQLYEQGLEKSPKSTVILGNLMMMLWVGLGTAACWLLYPLAAWIYLAIAMIMVYGVLRWLVCTNCYYYGKWCPIGWGKLCALFFRQGSIDKFGTGIGVKLAPMTYGLLSLAPLVLVIIALVRDFTVPKLVILILLLLVSMYSGSIGRKKSCAHCKMRLACPGSAVK